jgi:hypothetical protein
MKIQIRPDAPKMFCNLPLDVLQHAFGDANLQQKRQKLGMPKNICITIYIGMHHLLEYYFLPLVS